MTGDNSVVVGDNLKSETFDVKPVWYRHPDSDRDVILLDTPGFADTERTDTDILSTIANWLKETYAPTVINHNFYSLCDDTRYEKRVTLAGILYLHRISDNRMTNVSVTNLRMLKELCGKDSLANVVFVTTMWGKERREVAERREKQLRETFWASMIRLNAQVARFGDTYADGWSIIDKLNSRTPRPLKVQMEMVDEGKALPDTAAGAEVEKEMKKLIVAHEAKIKELMEKAKQEQEAWEAATKAAVEKAEQAEASVKQAEEAVKNAQTKAAKAVAEAELKLAAETAKMTEEHAEATRAAVDTERKAWEEERKKLQEQLEKLDDGLEQLYNPPVAETNVLDRLARARAEGERQAGHGGGLVGIGVALCGEAVKEVGALCAEAIGGESRKDQLRKVYAEEMFGQILQESQKAGKSGGLGGVTNFAVGAARNVGRGLGIMAGRGGTPKSNA